MGSVMVPSGLAGVVMVGLVAISYVLRRTARQGAWFHTETGALVLSAGVGVLSATAQAIQQGGLSLHVIEPAVLGALFSALSLSNPSVPVGQKPPMARRVDGGFIALRVISVLAMMAACTGIVFLLVNCGPVGQALAIDIAKCAAGEVPPALGTLTSEASAAAHGSAIDWATEETKLEALGIDAALCVIESAIATLSHPPPGAVAMAFAPKAHDRLEVARARLLAKAQAHRT